MLKLKMPDENSKLVYSTDKPIPRKERAVENALTSSIHPSQQKVVVRLERKGRGGKSVTVVEGLIIPKTEREGFLKQLKTSLGTGGTIKDTCIEIQGDHCDTLIMELVKIGYRPKRSGC